MPAYFVTHTLGFGRSISCATASATWSGRAFGRPQTPGAPVSSSVSTKIGITCEMATPEFRYSRRADSVNPFTANLAAL